MYREGFTSLPAAAGTGCCREDLISAEWGTQQMTQQHHYGVSGEAAAFSRGIKHGKERCLQMSFQCTLEEHI